jgi:predicted ribosome quality control (RQC) complex YloA/Tae2 family protein
MAKKKANKVEKTPEILRAKAKQFEAEALKLENRRYERIGKLIINEYHKKNFKDFDLDKFKKEISDIL